MRRSADCEYNGYLSARNFLNANTRLLQYGKLSDIYGRKESLIVAYLFFAIGWYVAH